MLKLNKSRPTKGQGGQKGGGGAAAKTPLVCPSDDEVQSIFEDTVMREYSLAVRWIYKIIWRPLTFPSCHTPILIFLLTNYPLPQGDEQRAMLLALSPKVKWDMICSSRNQLRDQVPPETVIQRLQKAFQGVYVCVYI